jgi:polar amino acid transport system substrate-binding protein
MPLRFAVSLALLVVCLFPALSAADVLKVRADSWMPYNGKPADEKPGYVVEIMRAIFETRGTRIDYQIQPWADALAAARLGEVDAVIGANEREAEGLIVPETPIGSPVMALFTRKNLDWKFARIASLKAVRLGVMEGYSYWDALDSYVDNPSGGHVSIFAGDTPLLDALAKLDSGELDVIAEMVPVMVWTLKSKGRSTGDLNIAYKHENEPIYVAFTNSLRGIKYAAEFDAGLQKLRASGELGKILSRYGVQDWEK